MVYAPAAIRGPMTFLTPHDRDRHLCGTRRDARRTRKRLTARATRSWDQS
jgi:hypothetical protein